MTQGKHDPRVDWLLDFNPNGRQEWTSSGQRHLRIDDLIIDGPSPALLGEALLSRIPVSRIIKISNGCLQRSEITRVLVELSFKKLSGAPFEVEGLTSVPWLEHELEIPLDFIEAYARGLKKVNCFILEGRLYKTLTEGQVVGLDKITHSFHILYSEGRLYKTLTEGQVVGLDKINHSFHILYSPVSRKGLIRMEAIFKTN